MLYSKYGLKAERLEEIPTIDTKMLNALVIQPLLLQLLTPVGELTPFVPLSVSLISLDLQKPLLSCLSKQGIEQERQLNSQKALDGSDDIDAPAGESVPLLQNQHGMYGGSSENVAAEEGKLRIAKLQREIDELDDNYDADYINANVNPVDNLNILSLMVIRDWNNKNDNEDWKVYSFGRYRIYMYSVNVRYALMLCTNEEYPSSIAISRMQGVSKILSSKL